MQPSEILDKAAERTAKQWGQGIHTDMDCCCALEAIVDVSDTGDERTAAIDFLREVIGTVGVAHWNDSPSRTQSEVVSALRSAAALARSEGR